MEGSDLRFRTAGMKDADAVRALTRAANAPMVPVIGREPMPMTADYAAAVRNHRIELLEVEGRLAGLIELVFGSGDPLTENVAVAPRDQGRGFGRSLIAHGESLARGMGHGRITLYTNAKMVRNLALYARLGYVETHRGVEGGFDRVYLAKDLAPA